MRGIFRADFAGAGTSIAQQRCNGIQLFGYVQLRTRRRVVIPDETRI